MDAVIEPLILDLVDWVSGQERTYEEAMDAWRTSCPKLPVWEEANSRGLISTELVGGRSLVRPTSLGLVLVELRRENQRRTRDAHRAWG